MFDALKLSTHQNVVIQRQMQTPHLRYSKLCPWCSLTADVVFCCQAHQGYYILTWGFWLCSFRLRGHVERPQSVKRVDVISSTFFFLYVKTILSITVLCLWSLDHLFIVMARIYDNIELKFTEGLQGIINNVRVIRVDFCVGYFNLRCWDLIVNQIDTLQGDYVYEGRDRKLRFLRP